MSRVAKAVIDKVLTQNNGRTTEKEIVEALMDERNVTEQTAGDYVTMYLKKEEQPNGTVMVYDPEMEMSAESHGGESEDGPEVHEVGAPTDKKFAEMTVYEDVGHPEVPREYKSGYYRRRVHGRKSDVQIATRALEMGHNLMLKGETGVGKGEMAKHIAANVNVPATEFNAGKDVRVDDLIGHYELIDQETKWVDGLVTKRVREGGFLIVNEWNAMGGAIAIMLHGLLEDDGVLSIPQTGEIIKPHDSFRVIGTMNPNYAGTKRQNRATMNRFFHMEVDYLDPHREVQVVLDNSGLEDDRQDEIESLVELANQLREDYKNGEIVTPISPRELIQVADFIKRDEDGDPWMELQDAAKMVIGNLADPNDQQAIEKVIEMTL